MLKALRVVGFKSIEDQTIALGPINVLIGANGSGKSNLLDFLRLLEFLGSANLQLYVGRSGGASSILHNGPRHTEQLQGAFDLSHDDAVDHYEMTLEYAAGDRLYFRDERVYRHGVSADLIWRGQGQKESGLTDAANGADDAARYVLWFLRNVRGYHFHDTSRESPMRAHCDLDAGRRLRSQGENLAAFLYRLREERPPYYGRILSVIQRVAPFLTDFVLEPTDAGKVLLRWASRDSEYDFGPQHLSDGTLRFIALAALFLQPEEDLPQVIVLDEPELGLHPLAIEMVGGMVRAAAVDRQIVLATQSTAMLDQFDPEELIVADLIEGASRFRRPLPTEFDAWLAEYTLSEVWEKNIIGGRPG